MPYFLRSLTSLKASCDSTSRIGDFLGHQLQTIKSRTMEALLPRIAPPLPPAFQGPSYICVAPAGEKLATCILRNLSHRVAPLHLVANGIHDIRNELANEWQRDNFLEQDVDQAYHNGTDYRDSYCNTCPTRHSDKEIRPHEPPRALQQSDELRELKKHRVFHPLHDHFSMAVQIGSWSLLSRLRPVRAFSYRFVFVTFHIRHPLKRFPSPVSVYQTPCIL